MQTSSAPTMQASQLAAPPRFINSRYHDEIRTDYAGFIRRIRDEVDRSGMCVLENFLHPDFLAELQSTAERLTPTCYKDGKRKSLVGGDLEGTGYWEVVFSDFTIQMVNDILAPFHIHLDASDIHPALNILLGTAGQDSIGGWHFDATYLTIAMPIIMPPPQANGDGKFRIWPNVRKFSQSPLKNRIFNNLFRIRAWRNMVKNHAINFVPGNFYFFYGFRSYHGTDTLDTTQCRANSLLNFGGPFFDRLKGKRVRYGA